MDSGWRQRFLHGRRSGGDVGNGGLLQFTLLICFATTQTEHATNYVYHTTSSSPNPYPVHSPAFPVGPARIGTDSVCQANTMMAQPRTVRILKVATFLLC